MFAISAATASDRRRGKIDWLIETQTRTMVQVSSWSDSLTLRAECQLATSLSLESNGALCAN